MGTHILDMRRAIKDALAEALTPVHVDEHPSATFEPQDIDLALKNRNVAVRVSWVGIPKDVVDVDDAAGASHTWAIWVVAKDGQGPAERRDLLGLPIVAEVYRLAKAGEWKPDPDQLFKNPEKLQVRESHRGESDVKGVTVWGVWFQQDAFIEPPTPTDLRDLLTIITRYDLAPKDGVFEATDTVRVRANE